MSFAGFQIIFFIANVFFIRFFPREFSIFRQLHFSYTQRNQSQSHNSDLFSTQLKNVGFDFNVLALQTTNYSLTNFKYS